VKNYSLKDRIIKNPHFIILDLSYPFELTTSVNYIKQFLLYFIFLIFYEMLCL